MASSLVTGKSKEGSRSEGGWNAQARSQAVNHLRVPAYLAAALFITTSLADMLTLAWPPNPGAVAWRFGTVGAASNYVLTLYFGIALLCWTAAFFGDARTLRISAVFSLSTGLVLLLLLGDFGMSALQLRRGVPEAEVAAYRIGTVKACIKYLMFAVALLLTGIFAWRAASTFRRSSYR